MKKLLLFVFLTFYLNIFGQNLTSLISDDGNVVELNNGKLKLAFKHDTIFNLYKFASVSNNESWVTRSGMTNAVWILTLVDENGVETKINSSSKVSNYKGFIVEDSLGIKAKVKCHWEVFLNDLTKFDVFATIAMSNNTDLSEWGFEAKLPPNYKMLAITYPRITFLKRNNETKLILPMGIGAEYDIPTTATTYSSLYPSSRGTMQLMCMHKGGEALYYSTHDSNANSKNFNVVTNATTAAILSTVTDASMAWTDDNGNFNLPWETLIGIHPNGWISAVKDWYKPFTYSTVWGKSKVQERNIIDWILNKNFWITINTVDGIEALTDRALRYFGPSKTGVQAYYWHNYPFDTFYPEYFPAQPNFVLAKNVIQNLGSHVYPYINGRLWDSTTDYFAQQNATNSAVMNKNGSIVTETHADVPSAVMCPSTVLWKNTLSDITDRLYNELNVDGIYYDQIASARSFPCWNPAHNHPLGGGDFWMKSYRELITNIRNKWGNSKVFSTEQNAECYLDLFEILYLTNKPRYANYVQVPVFQYVYSDRAISLGLNVFNSSNISLIYKNTLSLLWGMQLGAVQVDLLMNGILVDYRNFLRTMANFRGQNGDVFLGGELISEYIPKGDNPIVSIPDYGTSNVVRGAKWLTTDNQEVIILVNFDSKPHEVIVDGSVITLDRYSCKRITLESTDVINTEFSETIKVYSNESNIYILGANSNDQYRIYNLAGQLIIQGNVTKSEEVIVLRNKGIYVVTVLTKDNRQKVCKIIL